MAEMIDVFDGNHNPLGSLERVAVHKLGLWHQTFHCWIVGERAGFRFVLLQLRSKEKKNYPDFLDITAAGHLETGEAPLDGIRELQEELGVTISSAALQFLGIKHDVADEPNGIHNREFAHVFLLRDDREMAGYHLQEDEVSGLVEVEVTQGLRLFSGQVGSMNCKATRIEDGEVVSFARSIEASDLIPRVDNYYLKIFIMARLMLEGAEYLSI
jgi:isopentenyldiphosphate isomerase